jgi:uncharacterized damage-inducible protein DinB
VKTYDLFLEHGPKRRKTMVHVIPLMGCVVGGPTTDEALDATPDAIRTYARFLRWHGEAIDPAGRFRTRIAEEVTEGPFLGNGTAVFGPDARPLQRREVEPLLARHAWIREATLELVASLDRRGLERKPAQARAVGGILQHVLGAEGAYVSSGLGADRELNKLGRDAEKGELDVRDALAQAGELVAADLRAATPAQLKAVIPHGQQIGSARRTIRRALEHGWEHFQEIGERLG